MEPTDPHDHTSRRTGLVVLGGSAAGVALLGVLAVGLAAGPDTPTDRRTPVTNLSGTDSSSRPSPSPGPLRLRRDGALTPGG